MITMTTHMMMMMEENDAEKLEINNSDDSDDF